MTTEHPFLKHAGPPSTDGRQYFEPIEVRVERASQFNTSKPPDKWQFQFEGIEGYWGVPRGFMWEATPLYDGARVRVTLSQRGQYRDISQVELLEHVSPPVAENIEPPVSNVETKSSGSQSTMNQPPVDSRNRSIERQVAHKTMTDRLASVESLISVIVTSNVSYPERKELFDNVIKEREYFNEEWKTQQLALWEG